VRRCPSPWLAWNKHIRFGNRATFFTPSACTKAQQIIFAKAYPTAEGHTFLGWSLSHLGHTEQAIAQCKKAIELDPDYGNPYNDIGVYLIDLGRPDEAIPWLKKAMQAKRYCCFQFPHFNLGRVLLMKGRVAEAERAFERALSYDADYLPARKALEVIREREGEAL
jgi:Tfp pilus assembly protein PilF